jgi:hypothetical protein
MILVLVISVDINIVATIVSIISFPINLIDGSAIG